MSRLPSQPHTPSSSPAPAARSIRDETHAAADRSLKLRTEPEPRGRIQGLAAIGKQLAALHSATWFLLLGLPIGLFLVFSIPPFQGLDEPNHFFRVYSISTGTLVDPITGGRAGAVLPACVTDYAYGLYREGTQPVRFRPHDYVTPAGCGSRPARFQAFENTAVNSPLSYLPQVLGVSLGRSLGLSLPIVFYVGRLTGLLAFCSLVYLALRTTPRGQPVLLAVALLPMSLTLASEYSADGMTIALALLTIAGVVRCCVVEDATWRSFALTAAAAAALALSKNAYWLLVPMLLLVPRRLFPTPAVWIAARFAALLAIAAVTVAWYLQVRHVSFAAGAPPGVIDAHRQVAYILADKFRFARMVGQTLLGAQTGYFIWTGFVSWLGFSRSMAMGTPQAPPLVVAIAYLLLVEGYRRSTLRPFNWSSGALLRALLPVGIVTVTAVLIVVVGYVTASPVGALVVWIQGRYFLPLAAVPLVSLVMLNPGRSEGRPVAPMVPLFLVLAAYLLVKVPNYFY